MFGDALSKSVHGRFFWVCFLLALTPAAFALISWPFHTAATPLLVYSLPVSAIEAGIVLIILSGRFDAVRAWNELSLTSRVAGSGWLTISAWATL